ncbi:MAG: sigma-54-dependent Fis family transcriptional regulator [Deltaproteobacteria bacterium]|nr:sigma-54-dependent Fis family transcriptional regulator [Deltaproteobacteria bacterium]
MDEADAARAGTSLRHGYPEIVGRSTAMRELLGMLDRLVDSDATVLIEGENGTGKELVARALHRCSARRSGCRFVVQSCAALHDNLLESALFGHRRGAFTGAVADQVGLFAAADGGTLFLDEIGEMSPALQVKLLRVLQEGSFLPVGGSEPIEVDVRLIAATNRDLQQLVHTGKMREDLYWRIHVIPLRVPPLRERFEDLVPLAEHFLARSALRRGGQPKRLGPGVLERLRGHVWPGNVRELENEVERLIVLSGDQPEIDEALLSPRLRRPGEAAAGWPALPQLLPLLGGLALPAALEAVERALIGEALQLTSGNKTQAARRLGISRRNLIRKVQRYREEG